MSEEGDFEPELLAKTDRELLLLLCQQMRTLPRRVASLESFVTFARGGIAVLGGALAIFGGILAEHLLSGKGH